MNSQLKIFLLILLFFFGLDSLFSQTIPQIRQSGKKAEDFVPKGWDIIGQAKGDLNKDGIVDFAVVIKDIEEDMNSDADYPRILLILIKNADKTLTLSASSAKAIYCKHCGKAKGDPFESLEIINDGLVIGHSGGSAEKWAVFDTFKFINNTWVLAQEKKTSWQAADPDNTYKESTQSQNELGNIKLSDFEISKQLK